MLGTTFRELVFIRTSIFLLHYLPLHLCIALVLLLVTNHSLDGFTTFIEALTIIEVIFLVLVYIPRRRALQYRAKHPPIAPREERRRLMQKCLDTVPDGEAYLTKWFNEAPMQEIKKENLREFMAWAMLSKSAWGPEEDAELEEYVEMTEDRLGRKLDEGHGDAAALRLTVDTVNIAHRPLLWYCIVGLVDLYTSIRLRYNGFQDFRLRLSRFLGVFPFRFYSLTTRRTSTSSTISYWYKPHTSASRLPIVFIHGIGIGLLPYVNLLAELNHASSEATDGDVGIIALELPQISMRITSKIPDQEVLVHDIRQILDRHGFSKFVLASHSYGSVIATFLLHDPRFSRRISSLLLADPVTFLLHLPDVAYNFTRRYPSKANEHQLHYFASTDMCVANTLARHFFWTQNILWKEELQDRNVTVTLAGRDLITNVQAVGKYLTEDPEANGGFSFDEDDGREERQDWKNRRWKGEGIDVLWFDRLDHGQVFDHKWDYMRLVDVLKAYCSDRD